MQRRRKEVWRHERFRRLQQSVADRSRSTSVSSHAAAVHSCSAHSSSLVQVACDGRRRKLMLSSVRAWRRWAPIVRCAANYRCNMARSGNAVKPAFQSWRRFVVPLAPPQLYQYPDPHARPSVCTQVEKSRIGMLVEVVLASSVPHRLLRHFKLWQQQYAEFRSLIQDLVFSGRGSVYVAFWPYEVG